ncbi:MAG: hypothetical protein SPK65_00910, partial [Succinivibrio dextrinosolvens]|nr:hypothetical protein [Succinivibrio dextrinosolvens]
MKLKRFVAKDMRTALAKIKEELGAEAVIMSNKRVGPNVEIIAGVEGDIPVAPVKTQSRSKGQITSNIQEDSPLSRIIADDEVTLSSSKNKSEVKPVTKSVGGSKSEAFAKSLLEILERQQQSAPEVATEKKTAKTSKVKAKAPAPLSEQTGLRDLFIKEEEKKKEKKVESSHGISSYISKESESEKTEIEQLRHDVDSIRRLLQFELAGLMSDTKKREEPVRAMIYELLLSSGFDKSISNELSESIDS